MIFVAVGTQLPFDRLLRAVDEWAQRVGRDDVFAQAGPTDFQPVRIEIERFISPAEYRRRIENAELVIAHAGMGTIISALELAKPIIVMPRKAELREHRNDHQLATARRFADHKAVTVVMDEHELGSRLERLDEVIGDRADTGRLSPDASPELIAFLRASIRDEPG